MTASTLIETFNTHSLSNAQVRALMTARDAERDGIMVAVNANLARDRGQLQHVALYGPRGFGKSFMARVIEIEVAAKVQAGAEVAYLLLPEEQHNLARSPDALLGYFATQLKEDGTAWQAAAFTWPKGDALERWQAAEARLESAIDARFGVGKGLVIAVVENFDLLIHDVFAEDGAEERLRKWMTRRGNRVMLFVTATGHVDIDYDRPLFQAFRPVQLGGWSEDDCIAYFDRRRKLAGAEELGEGALAKARAIATFIGGNPRLAQLLSDVLDDDDALSVAELLSALADELADYYRRRIDDLPQLSRGLLDALIRGGEPCSATALAARVGTDQKTIARAFTVLSNADIIAGKLASDSKEKLFSVRDRVFVHFYRVRYGGVSRDESPLVHIVEFLEAFYTSDEKREQVAHYLELGRPREARVFFDLVDARRAYSAFVEGFPRRLVTYLSIFDDALSRSAQELGSALEERPEEIYTDAMAAAGRAGTTEARVLWHIVRAQAAVRLGLPEARQIFEMAREAAVGRHEIGFVAQSEMAGFLFQIAGDREAALQIGQELPIEYDQPILRVLALTERASMLGCVGRDEEAIRAASEAAELAGVGGAVREQAVATRMLAFGLRKLGRDSEALEVAVRATEIARTAGDPSEETNATLLLAASLERLGRHELAVERAARAADLARSEGRIGEQALAVFLSARSLGELKRSESVAEAERAIVLAEEAGNGELAQAARYLYLDCAEFADGIGAVRVLGDLLGSSEKELALRLARPRHYLRTTLAAVTRSRDWEAFGRLVEREATWFASQVERLDFRLAGATIAELARSEGRPQALASASALLEALSRLVVMLGVLADTRTLAVYPATWFVLGLGKRCSDPGFLRDVADVLERRLERADFQASLLRALATFHEGGRTPAALERLAPDMAALIGQVWDVSQPQDR